MLLYSVTEEPGTRIGPVPGGTKSYDLYGVAGMRLSWKPKTPCGQM